MKCKRFRVILQECFINLCFVEKIVDCHLKNSNKDFINYINYINYTKYINYELYINYINYIKQFLFFKTDSLSPIFHMPPWWPG